MKTEALPMTLTGTITHITARKVARTPRVVDFGLDGTRYRLSGFAARKLAVPPIGSRVSVKLDGAGYVREIATVAE